MLYSAAMEGVKRSPLVLQYLVPAALVLFSSLLYLAFRSVSLDDFDSYSFALALERFDVALQQPQPPGFPVYVVLGRVLHGLTGDALSALTLLSALSGVGLILLVYALGRALDCDRRLTGVGAALPVALLPMGWLTAEKALSDTPGLAATLLALWLLWRRRAAVDARKREGDARPMYGGLLAAALVTGLALGIRPQNTLPVFLLIGYLLLRDIVRRDALWPWLVAGAVGALGVLAWLAPTARSAGGLAEYVALLQSHAAHVGRADSLMGMGLPLAVALRARMLAFGDTFLTATIGVGLFGPLGVGDALRLLAMALVIAPGLVRANWRRGETWLLVGWIAVVTAQVFLFEAPDRPRLMLPILPPLALLVAHGWSRIPRPRRLAPAMLVASTAALLAQGAPLAAQLASIPTPPAQATAYVAAHYPPEETLVAAGGSFRAVQVELPAYRLAYLYRFDAGAVKAAIDGGARYVVIFDRDQFTPEALDVLSAGGLLAPLEDRTFVRDRRVHTQNDQVRVQVLTPADLVPPAALALPPDGCIDIGGDADGRYLAQGWFRPEDIGGARGRWAGETLTSTVRLTLEPGREYRLRFRALAYPADQAVTLRVAGKVIARAPLGQGWAEAEVHVPEGVITPGQVTTLELVHAVVRSPFEATNGGSSDTRPLSAAYDWLCVSPP